jgi:hypothetical protein
MTLKQTGKILTCLICSQPTTVKIGEEPPRTCSNPKCDYYTTAGLPWPDYHWWVEDFKWEREQRRR